MLRTGMWIEAHFPCVTSFGKPLTNQTTLPHFEPWHLTNSDLTFRWSSRSLMRLVEEPIDILYIYGRTHWLSNSWETFFEWSTSSLAPSSGATWSKPTNQWPPLCVFSPLPVFWSSEGIKLYNISHFASIVHFSHSSPQPCTCKSAELTFHTCTLVFRQFDL